MISPVSAGAAAARGPGPGQPAGGADELTVEAILQLSGPVHAVEGAVERVVAIDQAGHVPGQLLGMGESAQQLLIADVALAPVVDHMVVEKFRSHPRADSKFQDGSSSGWRLASASSAVMSCITACIPVRID